MPVHTAVILVRLADPLIQAMVGRIGTAILLGQLGRRNN